MHMLDIHICKKPTVLGLRELSQSICLAGKPGLFSMSSTLVENKNLLVPALRREGLFLIFTVEGGQRFHPARSGGTCAVKIMNKMSVVGRFFSSWNRFRKNLPFSRASRRRGNSRINVGRSSRSSRFRTSVVGVLLGMCLLVGIVMMLASTLTPTHALAANFTMVTVGSGSPVHPMTSMPRTTNATPPPNTQVNASKAITRIPQLDPGQYRSQQDYDKWAYSACSAAAMTEVLDAYGLHYRIADILSVEASIGEITPELGLLEPIGIDRTVARFGFQATWHSGESLDALIGLANQGTPLIIGFPPERWSGGHLLVLRGGDSQQVFLVDSSKLNMQAMGRATFLKYWAGFAVAVTPGPYAVVGKPTLSVDFINRVLASYHSPAAGKGQSLYDLGVKYGIDPAFALAFFMHESTFGTAGEARVSFSLGNLRCIPNFKCQDGYAWFASWEDGFGAWYRLIHDLYIDQWGLVTVDQIIPRYAPNSDNNNEASYISSLKHYLDSWHHGQIRV